MFSSFFSSYVVTGAHEKVGKVKVKQSRHRRGKGKGKTVPLQAWER